MLQLFTACLFQSPRRFFQTNDCASPSRKQNLHVLLLTAPWLRCSTQTLPWVFWGDSVQLRIGLPLDYTSDITVNQRESWLNSIWLEGGHKGDLWYKYWEALLLMPSIQWRKNKRVVTVLPEPTYSRKSILHKLIKGPLFCLCKDDSKDWCRVLVLKGSAKV